MRSPNGFVALLLATPVTEAWMSSRRQQRYQLSPTYFVSPSLENDYSPMDYEIDLLHLVSSSSLSTTSTTSLHASSASTETITSSLSSSNDSTTSTISHHSLPYFATPIIYQEQQKKVAKHEEEEEEEDSTSSAELESSSSSLSSSPSEPDWTAIAHAAFADCSKPIYLFDGVCQFCNGGVHLCMDMDEDGHFRYASLHSLTGKALLQHNGKDPNDHSSLVLVTDVNQAYFKSDAVLRIAEQLNGLPAPVRFLSKVTRHAMPAVVRDSAYHLISVNRHRLSSLLSSEEGPTCRVDLDHTRFVEEPEIEGDYQI